MTTPTKGDQFTAQTFIDAMPGTGGVKSAIARKVGCVYNTVQKYIDKYPTVRQAYEDECARVLDLAVSVVVQNINLAAKLQQETQVPVDTSDAKWYLSRKGKDQGWSDRQEIAIDGIDIDAAIETELARVAAKRKAANAGKVEGVTDGNDA